MQIFITILLFTNMDEIFKKHKSGYLVSNYGRVKGKTVEFLKGSKTTAGYITYGTLGYAHRLVCETFIGDIPTKMEINHIDFNKENNRIDNLEIVTRSENQIHAINGNRTKNIEGEANPMSHLKTEDVLSIYKMIKEGYDNIDIAIKFNLHDRYVSLLRHGKRWKKLYNENFNNEDNYYSLGCNFLNKKSLLEILNLITNTNMSNIEIAKLYHLDKTTISKVRNKKIWGRAWRYFQKEKHLIIQN